MLTSIYLRLTLSWSVIAQENHSRCMNYFMVYSDPLRLWLQHVSACYRRCPSVPVRAVVLNGDLMGSHQFLFQEVLPCALAIHCQGWSHILFPAASRMNRSHIHLGEGNYVHRLLAAAPSRSWLSAPLISLCCPSVACIEEGAECNECHTVNQSSEFRNKSKGPAAATQRDQLLNYSHGFTNPFSVIPLLLYPFNGDVPQVYH